MAGSARRERQLAREHYERQQARRAARMARQRRVQQVGAVVVVAALIVAGVVVLATQFGGEDKVRAAGRGESGSASPKATAAPLNCKYPKAGEAARKVGAPLYDPHLDDTYRQPFSVQLATNRGNIRIALDAAKAPCTANSFRHLVEAQYYDNTTCHRLTTANIYVLQCGDPTGTGSGGPGYQFGEENLPTDADKNYPAGTVAMANAGKGTNGSQFFLVYQDTTLPPNYSIFGHIMTGLDVVRKIAKAGSDNANGQGDGHPKLPVTIKTTTVGRV